MGLLRLQNRRRGKHRQPTDSRDRLTSNPARQTSATTHTINTSATGHHTHTDTHTPSACTSKDRSDIKSGTIARIHGYTDQSARQTIRRHLVLCCCTTSSSDVRLTEIATAHVLDPALRRPIGAQLLLIRQPIGERVDRASPRPCLCRCTVGGRQIISDRPTDRRGGQTDRQTDR